MVLLTSCSEKMKPNSIEIYLSETEKETTDFENKKKIVQYGLSKSMLHHWRKFHSVSHRFVSERTIASYSWGLWATKLTQRSASTSLSWSSRKGLTCWSRMGSDLKVTLSLIEISYRKSKHKLTLVRRQVKSSEILVLTNVIMLAKSSITN